MFKNKSSLKTFVAKFHKKVAKKSVNLSIFKSEMASCLNISSLDSLFFTQADIRKKYEPTYISLIDDPRITIDVAYEFKDVIEAGGVFENEDYYLFDEYFEQYLKESSANILFPVKSSFEFAKRCLEILCLFEGENFGMFSYDFFLKGLMKANTYRLEKRINYTDCTGGLIGYPEFQMYLNTFDTIFNSGYAMQFIKDSFEIVSLDAENGYADLEDKLVFFMKGAVWTHSNVGCSAHIIAIQKVRSIQNENFLNNLSEDIRENLDKRKKINN